MEFGLCAVNKDVKRSPEMQIEAKEESEDDKSFEVIETKEEYEDDKSFEVAKEESEDNKSCEVIQAKEESEYDKSCEVAKEESEDDKSCEVVQAKEECEDSDKSYEVDGKSEETDSEDGKSEETDSEENLSPYEYMIQKNREAKRAFLQSIQIEEAKIDLAKAVHQKKKKPVKREFKEVTTPSVLRKSRRLANISAELSEGVLYSSKVAEEIVLKKIISPVFSFKDVLNEDLYDKYVADMCIQESKCNAEFITYDKSDLEKMTVTEPKIVKILPLQITALSWYPSPEQLVVAAAYKNGTLGVLNMSNECNPYTMRIHNEGITHMQFNPFNPAQLISSSYDGKVRCGDMVQHIFSEIYNVSGKTCCTYFDVLSETTFLVAQEDGCVAVVDTRIYGRRFEKKHACHENCIISVSIHPVNRNIFISAGKSIGSMRIWDLRKLQKTPVAEKYYHNRAGLAAYFSPVTGNYVLTTTYTGVSIWDCSNFRKFELKQQIEHKFSQWKCARATWLPYSEEAFVIGGDCFPRKIEVYDKNMFVYNIQHECLVTVPFVNVFHPRRHALASGGRTGKLYVFT